MKYKDILNENHYINEYTPIIMGELDKGFIKSTEVTMNNDGNEVRRPIMVRKLDNKTLSPEQLFYYLEQKFKDIPLSSSVVDRLLKQLIEDWYTGFYKKNKSLSINFLPESVMLEKELINEMAYPNSWDLEEFKRIQTFNGRIKYCKQHLEQISTGGSSRIVFKIDDEKVFKLAKNKRGLDQNEVEIDFNLESDLYTTVFDYDKYNCTWLEAEYCYRRPTVQDFKKITGYDFKFIQSFINWNSENIRLYGNPSPETLKIFNYLFKNVDFFNDLGNTVNYLHRKTSADIKRISSWGIVKRDGKDELVILDYGLNDTNVASYYEETEKSKIFKLNEISKKDLPLDSFRTRKELNTKIWKDNKLDKEVRSQLIEIAEEATKTIGIDIEIEDIIFVGSLASYNWSSYSDVDLHVVVDYDKISKDTEVVDELLWSKKKLWNDEHVDLLIYNYNVEIYFQNIDEKVESNGIYSIKDDKWLKEPEPISDEIDENYVSKSSIKNIKKIDSLISDAKSSEDKKKLKNTLKQVSRMSDKIATSRKSGLASGGEFSNDNIIFKVLRRMNKIGELKKIATYIYDKINTIK